MSFSLGALKALCTTQKLIEMGQRRSAGGSPVSWLKDEQESTGESPALRRFS